VLADEPTSNLDDAAAAAVIDLLLGATQRQGATLVVATHDSRLKSRIATELALSASAVAAFA
jgi:putative ABC transport system ATP-binding protein